MEHLISTNDDDLDELADQLAGEDVEVDSLRRRTGGLAQQPLRGGTLVQWSGLPPAPVSLKPLPAEISRLSATDLGEAVPGGAGGNHMPSGDGDKKDAMPAALTGQLRRIVCLWRKGKSGPQIGEHLNISPRSVAKRIVEARKEHGEEVVPKKNAQSRQSK